MIYPCISIVIRTYGHISKISEIFVWSKFPDGVVGHQPNKVGVDLMMMTLIKNSINTRKADF
jgi:cystathionine beta-lyase family protein involved in aluminum resistance